VASTRWSDGRRLIDRFFGFEFSRAVVRPCSAARLLRLRRDRTILGSSVLSKGGSLGERLSPAIGLARDLASLDANGYVLGLTPPSLTFSRLVGCPRFPLIGLALIAINATPSPFADRGARRSGDV
jgi:hypothetical protein